MDLPHRTVIVITIDHDNPVDYDVADRIAHQARRFVQREARWGIKSAEFRSSVEVER